MTGRRSAKPPPTPRPAPAPWHRRACAAGPARTSVARTSVRAGPAAALAALLLLGAGGLVQSLPRVRGPPGGAFLRPAAGLAPGHDRRAAPAFEGRRGSMLRLRGGVPVSDEESTESSTPREAAAGGEPAAHEAAAAAAAAGVEPTGVEAQDGAEQQGADGEEDGGGEEGEGKGEGEGEDEDEGADAMMERPKPTPEVIRQMNERMWEAAQEGNEPLLAKVLAGGANVNAFCRGPDRWLNISIGEIAGADEAHTGLNAHWMELNNYTALHLAAACGNAGIIDALMEAGADINVECLQRVHPFPTHHGSSLSFLTRAKPMIFKCTPLRLARAANCGRCFYTSLVASLPLLPRQMSLSCCTCSNPSLNA